MNGHKGQTVGYVRVSTIDQNVDRQIEALGEVDKSCTPTESVGLAWSVRSCRRCSAMCARATSSG